jgi:predicted N-acetyltransferase YhbS
VDSDRTSDVGVLETEAVVVRSLERGDLSAIVNIDRRLMGRSRQEYYEVKVGAALDEGKLQTSFVAELDGLVVGFLLVKLYYGEFGRSEPVAVIDSIGVHPDFAGKTVGQALMRQMSMNLGALHVERVETQVSWEHFGLLKFLAAQGFTPAPRLCLSREL